MKYVGKQKAKVDLRTKRFRVVRCFESLEGREAFAIVDRDVSRYGAPYVNEDLVVARVARPYARALCALMNADQEVFPLMPRRNDPKTR